MFLRSFSTLTWKMLKDVFSFQKSQRKRFVGSMFPAATAQDLTFNKILQHISLYVLSKERKNPQHCINMLT
jgi:hypothetical protein